MENGRIARLALILAVGVSGPACVSSFQSVSVSLPDQARIGVVVTDAGGNLIETAERNYVLNAVMDNGLVPVALNEIQTERLVRQIGVLAEAARAQQKVALAEPGAVPPPPAPAEASKAIALQLTDLRDYLVANRIDAVLIVYVHTSGFDEDLRAVMIRTNDMAVVGSRFYRRRVMTALHVGLIPAFAAGAWLVPWFYLRNPDPVNYGMVRDFVASMRRGSAR